MANDTTVGLFMVLLIAVGIVISAVAASTHGSAATVYTTILIGFGLSIILIFALTALIANGRAKSAAMR
ncbi:MAG: hypothetical protein OK439_06595 [Thaumarchaeota archaeon]|nr:hypothetical protein [Nitrososphaerota archaeon]